MLLDPTREPDDFARLDGDPHDHDGQCACFVCRREREDLSALLADRHPDADPACTVPGCGYLDLCDACCARVDAAARAAGDEGVEPDRCPSCGGVTLRSDWICRACGPPPLAGDDLGASRR